MKFVVTVLFELKSEYQADFLPLILENAAASLAQEQDCVQFDVCRDSENPDEIFLYEVYQSADAFQQHLKSDHYLKFGEQTAHMVANKQIRTFQTVI